MLFDEKSKVKEPDQRHIINIVEIEGNSVKSSFFKWLFVEHENEIGRIDYGSASQLRSAVTNIGIKKIYIIDLARSKSKQDKEEDLLSMIEDIKSGLVANQMYGQGNVLIMPSPHVIISCNYLFKYDLLSKDRWQVYEILKKEKKLGKLNDLVKKYRKEESLKKA